jgi:3-dehydroquinate synthase
VRTLDVALGERGYTISIAAGLFDDLGHHLALYSRDGSIIVVTDEGVWAALGERFQRARARSPIAMVPLILPAGEGSKSWAALSWLVDRLAEAGVERGGHIAALGGGMIGDLTGFASAIFKRGCGYVQVPTTLLAQVDSSVGGKTAINIDAGKNLVGAFHQPSAVLIDPTTLDSLPPRQLRAGYAEIVKYGLIQDRGFFDWCEANGASLIDGDMRARLHAIESCVGAKADIVAADERETRGRRALLNLGHTFGHALEAEAGYSDRLLHGEAVALGMALAFRFSAIRGLCPAEEAERVTAHLRSVGLPTMLRETEIAASGAQLAERMRHDKKSSGGRLRLILVRGIGEAFVDSSVEVAEVEAFLDRELG